MYKFSEPKRRLVLTTDSFFEKALLSQPKREMTKERFVKSKDLLTTNGFFAGRALLSQPKRERTKELFVKSKDLNRGIKELNSKQTVKQNQDEKNKNTIVTENSFNPSSNLNYSTIIKGKDESLNKIKPPVRVSEVFHITTAADTIKDKKVLPILPKFGISLPVTSIKSSASPGLTPPNKTAKLNPRNPFAGTVTNVFEYNESSSTDHVCDKKCLHYNMSFKDIKYLMKKDIPALAVPTMLGWKRVKSQSNIIVYTSPCYKKFYDFDKLHNYLLITECDLPINFFSFSSAVDGNNVFVPACASMLIEDVTKGQELLPISVINVADSIPNTDNLVKEYTSKYIHGANVFQNEDDSFLVCCECPNDCKDKLNCPCFQLTLDNCDQQTKDRGHDYIGYSFKTLPSHLLSGIFECNKKCKCRQTCVNRVAQEDIIYKLQLFKTPNKGWGVRTLHDIPKGSFICKYVGKLVTLQKATRVNSVNGDWKYMATLRVAQPFKDGYEAEVINGDVEIEIADKCTPKETVKADNIKPETMDSPDSGIFSCSEPKKLKRKSNRSTRTKFKFYNRNVSLRGVPIKWDRNLAKREANPEITVLSKSSKMRHKSTPTSIPKTTNNRISIKKIESKNLLALTDCELEKTNRKVTISEKISRVRSKPTNRLKWGIGAPLKLGSKLGLSFNSPQTEQKSNTFLHRKAKETVLQKIKTDVSRRGDGRAKNSLTKIGRYVIDAKDEGNIGRYLNHSCDPNCFPQYIFIDNHDLNFPQLALFTSKNVTAGEELTWDYKYDIKDTKNSEILVCHCGSKNCLGRVC